MSISLQALVKQCEELLTPGQFKDYCPNGLQVEGKAKIERLVTGVTASQALIDQAIAWQADAILVHHGYFWKGESQPIVGHKQRRIKALLQNDISLIGYHLPLDAHATLGNNAQLAKLMGWKITAGMDGEVGKSIGLVGELAEAMSGEQLAQALAEKLGRAPLHIASHQRQIKTIAWCSGGAQGFIEQAAALGVDAYLSGEASEQTFHLACELGVDYFGAGHHATERYGAKALGEYLAGQFDLEHRFIDIDNPV